MTTMCMVLTPNLPSKADKLQLYAYT